MKKFKKALMFVLSLFLLSSCNLFDNSKSDSTNSSNLSSDSSFSTDITAIRDVIDSTGGKYTIEGTITKVRLNEDDADIWIQNYNDTTQDDDAILIKNAPRYYNPGEFVKVTGTYGLVNDLPTITSEKMSVQSGSDSHLHAPLKMTSTLFNDYSKYLLNRLVKIENAIIVSLSYYEDSNNVLANLNFSGLTIEVRVQCGNATSTVNIKNEMQKAKDKGANVNLTGLLEVNLDKDGFQVLVIDEADFSMDAIIGEQSLQIYAINDFHGSVVPNGNEAGILKVGSFLKEKKETEDAILINSGDLWQGSIESNLNHGELLTDCMNEIGFDCFTLGNHEFDWGATFIERNRNRKSKDNYQTPFLAANIYNYDINKKEVLDFANLGNKYTIKTMENGLKVGIIGVIGEDQITSISSQYADAYTFENPTPIIKELSDKLRVEQEVDVVLLSCHTNQESIKGALGEDSEGITLVSSVSNKRYVDAVFCAHSHYDETDYVNGVPFIQGGSNGKYISSVKLSIGSAGNISCDNYENLNATRVSYTKADETLNELVNTYKAQSDIAGSEVVGKLSGQLTKSDTLVNFVCAAIANYAAENDIEIDYAIANTGRANISGSVTYASLYKALPFDNKIYVIEASGSDISKEARYNAMYRVNPQAINNNKRYKVAVLDYLAFHRNSRRNYDYFLEAVLVSEFIKSGYEIYNYRDLTADYMRSFGNATIDVSNYTDTNLHHDTSKLTTNVTFS